MTCYSVWPRDPICVKGYGFLYFARNMGKNIGKKISKNLSSKYSEKFLDHAKQSATGALKTASKRAIQKTAEASDDLNCNKVDEKIAKSQKIHHGLIQLQLKKKYLEKNVNLQKKDRKLLII